LAIIVVNSFAAKVQFQNKRLGRQTRSADVAGCLIKRSN